ncbi:hypothetical protein GSH19_04995 [Lactobacillus sp. S2-2]|uniref:hypothetical protein n=1 Tax=Lactobacillus sp. S2-2 TaxID=2692917 RepID=UPI001F264C68|nr:hypothetical protein [Lactobacillus sp. S2-2]MCF6515508.1 hypothetical protein [Lactobacillus sp. S2-2]
MDTAASTLEYLAKNYKSIGLSTLIIIFLVIAILFILYIFITMLQKKSINNHEMKNSRQIQIESYFRELNGENQFKIFDQWMRAFTHMDENKNIDVKELIHDTLIYGSDKTTALLALYQNYIFKTSKDKDLDNEILLDGITHKEIKQSVFIVSIISSLKFDLTGYKTSALTLMKSKFNDYNEFEAYYKHYIKEIDKEIKVQIKE